MRTIKVHKNKDGSYRIREQDKGFFSTNAGGTLASPRNCPANTSAHGHTVRAGVVGTLKGLHHGQGHWWHVQPDRDLHGHALHAVGVHRRVLRGDSPVLVPDEQRECKFKYDYHAKRTRTCSSATGRIVGTVQARS